METAIATRMNTKKSEVLAKRSEFRDLIISFTKTLSGIHGITFGDNDNYPLTHKFTNGIYIRQIAMPAGTVCVGKIHRHEHPNFLLKGRVTVVTEEGGIQELTAPVSMISPAGTQRAVYVHEDAIWTTIHSNPDNLTDLDELEELIIAKSYNDLPDIIQKELLCHGF